MPSAVANSISVDYRALNTPSDWGLALDWALGFGYRGTVSHYGDESDNPVWHIELNGPGNPLPVTAGIDDVLVWDEISLEAMSQAVFDTRYTPA